MAEPKLPALIQAMLIPDFYPHECTDIKLMQTQMSFVLLTGNFAYKMKKSINLGYLDYTTLEKRKFFCYQELNLNRRLSPDIYLEVIPIVKQGAKFALGGKGEATEYILKMQQLPQERMMDVLLDANKVTEEMIRKVAQKIATFHQATESNAEISKYGKLDVIRINIEENFSQTPKKMPFFLNTE